MAAFPSEDIRRRVGLRRKWDVACTAVRTSSGAATPSCGWNSAEWALSLLSECSLITVERVSRATPLSPDERRRAIIEATLPLLIANGVELSTKEIAKAAGIAEGTIFRVFETKAELVHATLDAALAPTAALAAMAALPDDQSLTERLAAIIEIVSDEIVRTRSLFASVFGPRPHEGPPKPHGHRPHADRLQMIRMSLADALAPYSDQISVPIERVGELIAAVSVAGRMFSPDHQLDDPAEWAQILAYGIAKGKQ